MVSIDPARERHDEMKKYFIELSKSGRLVKYTKKEEVKYRIGEEFGIVTSGRISEAEVSKEGTQKDLYFLVEGEIFGEIALLEGTPVNSIIYSNDASTVSFIKKEIVEKEILANRLIYKHFYHSLNRKYMLAKSQLLNLVFKDSFKNVAATLHRIAVLNSKGVYEIDLTHQHIANLIGCSRITVTKVLNLLKEKGIISMDKRIIKVTRMDELMDFFD